MPRTRILLVEDEAATRDLLRHVIGSAGYPLDVAPDFGVADDRLSSEAYGLVIADWRLPDGDGIAILDRAAALGVSTILMSGYLFQLPKGSADRHHVLMKPIRPAEILAVLRAVIGEPQTYNYT